MLRSRIGMSDEDLDNSVPRHIDDQSPIYGASEWPALKWWAGVASLSVLGRPRCPTPQQNAHHDQACAPEREYWNLKSHWYQGDQRGDRDHARPGQHPEDSPLEERMSGTEQRRSPEGQRDRGKRSVLAGMGYSEFVSRGDRPDTSYHGQVEVIVGGAGQPAWVLRGGERPAGGPLAAGEVEPPHRHAAHKGDHERRYRGRGRFDLAKGRAGHQDRLPKSEDDEQPAALGEVPTFDRPIGGGRASQTRRPEAGHPPHVLQHQGDRPQHVPRLALEQAARHPQHRGYREPS